MRGAAQAPSFHLFLSVLIIIDGASLTRPTVDKDMYTHNKKMEERKKHVEREREANQPPPEESLEQQKEEEKETNRRNGRWIEATVVAGGVNFRRLIPSHNYHGAPKERKKKKEKWRVIII